MKPFPPEHCAPPSTMPEGRDTHPMIVDDDRPTDPDPKPPSFVPPSFVPFGRMSDSELRGLMKHILTPLPISRRSTPPASARSYVVYERIVDTRRLRRGAPSERSSIVDLLSVVVLVGVFTGVTAVAVLALTPAPPQSHGSAANAFTITSQNTARSSAASTPAGHPKLP